jgi:hypothetical protein
MEDGDSLMPHEQHARCTDAKWTYTSPAAQSAATGLVCDVDPDLFGTPNVDPDLFA